MKPKMKVCDGCGNEKLIWKNSEGNRYCKYCWSSRNTHSKPIANKKLKPIAPRSRKKQIQDKEYSKLRKDFLYYHPICQAQLQNICTTQATDVHHKAGRIGSNYLDTTTWLSVCRMCHTWIEEHPKESRELGYSKSKIT